jgi:hypothetical protein
LSRLLRGRFRLRLGASHGGKADREHSNGKRSGFGIPADSK